MPNPASIFSYPRVPTLARAALAALVLALATASSLHGQLYVGDTVRLSVARHEFQRGAFVRADTAAIYLRTPGDSTVLRTPYGAYEQSEVLLGYRHAGGRAVGIGAAIGIGIGAGVGLGSALLHPGHGGLSSSATSTVVGALIGAALGSLVGTTASGVREELWRPVIVQRLATAPTLASIGDTVTGARLTVAAAATNADTMAAGSLVHPRPQHDPGVVAAGDTVRLFAGRDELVHGILASADTAALEVIPMDATQHLRFGRTQFSTGDVKRGDRRRGASALNKGMAVGVGVGAAFVTLGVAGRSPKNEGMDVLAGIFLGGASALLGTVVGGAVSFTMTDQWIAFDPATLRTVVAR